ncbi:MAG: hypothetical protein WA801_09270, partial [Pseudolabrys sp.]
MAEGGGLLNRQALAPPVPSRLIYKDITATARGAIPGNSAAAMGSRKTTFKTIRGSRKDAERELAKLI